MPGNLYGVSQPGFTALALNNPGDTAVTAGTETNFLASVGAVVAPGQGNWFACIFYTVVVLFGATAPGSLTVAGRLGALADFDSQTLAAALLVNAATVVMTGCLVSPALQSNFFPTGAVVNVSVNCTTQNVTAKGGGSRAVLALFRGIDA